MVAVAQNFLRTLSLTPKQNDNIMIDDKEITLTSPATILAMTAALPDIPNGARPVEYEQEIESASIEADEQAGKPDPAHND